MYGEWQREGKVELAITEDLITVFFQRSVEWEVARSGSIYRVIYNIGIVYYAIYFKDITPDSMRFNRTAIYETSPEAAAQIANLGDWRLVFPVNTGSAAAILSGTRRTDAIIVNQAAAPE